MEDHHHPTIPWERQQMDALVFDRFGGPEVLEMRRLPDPAVPPGHVQLAMKAIGLNFAGARQAVSDNIDVTVRYRYFAVTGLEMETFGGELAAPNFRSHSLLGGITFNFGAPR